MTLPGGIADSWMGFGPAARRWSSSVGVRSREANFLFCRENFPLVIRPLRSFSLVVPTLMGVKSLGEMTAWPLEASGDAPDLGVPVLGEGPVTMADGGARALRTISTWSLGWSPPVTFIPAGGI